MNDNPLRTFRVIPLGQIKHETVNGQNNLQRISWLPIIE